MNQKSFIKIIFLISKAYLFTISSSFIILEAYSQVSLAQTQSNPTTPEEGNTTPTTPEGGTTTPPNIERETPTTPPTTEEETTTPPTTEGETTTPKTPEGGTTTPTTPEGETPPTPPTTERETPPTPPTIERETPTIPPTIERETPTTPPTIERETPTTPPTIEKETPSTPPTTERENPTTPPTIEKETPSTPPTTEREIPSNPQETQIRNYIGVGGNFGLNEDGDTALGENAFSVFSKIGLTNNLSFRPAATISDKAVILVPLTIDFPIKSSTVFRESQTIVVPYIGGGTAISTGNDSSVELLLTGGVDVHFSPKFTANAGVNVGFFDETDFGLQLGIGYNF